MEKAEQRRLARIALNALPPEARLQASHALCQRLLTHSLFQKAKTVFLFAPLPSEPSIEAIFQAKGIRTGVFPKVTASGLTWHSIGNWSDLQPRASKVPEPPDHAPEVKLAQADLILVPGVAFDSKGNRLGRGGGYYDRVLAELPPAVPRIGLFFDCQELPELFTEPHDQPLTLILTESRILTNF